ncbi:MAG: hypothetical protein P8M30_15670 [Planctomycetaceae bacterium]|jgi:hypothetical protein|nr:hypothetical protein [Planctomycetaceae bacterium]MDC0308253.1 hypothetical protein [Planctomycetaceae bacterium]MDG2390747.1 hypothetical protein [Planctomycetaceae bacterium]
MIAQFTLRLIVGISFMWVVMPRKEVTCGFFRIQMMVVLGLSVLTGLTIGRDSVPLPSGEPLLSETALRVVCGLSAFVAYVGSVVWMLARRKSGDITVYLIFLISSLCLVALVASEESLKTSTGWLIVVSEFATALVLGAAMTGMLLGHWYLTATTMSIKPLSTLTLWFGVAAGIRLLVSATSWLVFAPEMPSSTETVWLALRWIAGILGPLAVFVMTWKILEYRNTQSATGVLFVGVILTFLGELSALLLYRSLGIPL